ARLDWSFGRGGPERILTWVRQRSHALRACVALAAAASLITTPAWAGPQGGQVVGGQAIIQTLNQETLIKQSTKKSIINWNSYKVLKGESVIYQEPNSNSISLNRVLGGQAASILGKIQSNGQVWLVDPNGVLFGKGSTVNAAGLLATTADIANSDFMSGKYQFGTASPNAAAGVANYGTINTQGGSTVLAAPNVDNEGTINAKLGTVAVGAGKTFAVDFDGDNLLSFAVTAPAANAQIKNAGTIAADGGTVQLTARSVGNIVDNVINTTGIVQANSVSIKNGTVILDGGASGTVSVGGTVSAQGLTPGSTGGTVQVTGANIDLTIGANINASGQAGGGLVLIVGNFHGAGPLPNAQSVTIAQGATINADATDNGNGGQVAVGSQQHNTFNGTITARGGPNGGNGGYVETSSAADLTIGTGTVNTLAPMGATGTWLLDPSNLYVTADGTAPSSDPNASVVSVATLETALLFNDVTLATSVGGSSCTNVTCAAGSATNQAGDITVASNVTWATGNTLTLSAYNNININAAIVVTGAGGLVLNVNNSGTANPNAAVNFLLGSVQFTNEGANPTLSIGSGVLANVQPYTLVFTTAELQNINANLSGLYALAQPLDATAVASWTPLGTDGAGNPQNSGNGFTGIFNGLGNTIANLTINNPSAYVGLFGYVGTGGTVQNVGLVGGSTTGGGFTGALAGYNAGTLTNVYATGAVSGDNNASGGVGGLVGFNAGSISRAFATGDVAYISGANDNYGGLVGQNSGGSISESYSTGSVTGGDWENGGLVGYNNNGGTITNSYATGAVSAGFDGDAGGLFGGNYQATITSSYATGAVSDGAGRYLGALVGWDNDGASIVTSYATGTVNASLGLLSGRENGTVDEFSTVLNTVGDLASAMPAGFSPTVWGNVNNQTTPYLLNLTNNPQPVYLAADTTHLYQLLFNLGQVQNINSGLSGHYALANSLDALTDPTTPATWIPIGTDGAGSVGNGGDGFSGTFNGLGNTISNLTVNLGLSNYVGLFGYVGAGGAVKNIGLVSDSV